MTDDDRPMSESKCLCVSYMDTDKCPKHGRAARTAEGPMTVGAFTDTVAEAIWRARHAPTSWEKTAEWKRDIYRGMARAAIDALGLTQEWGAAVGDPDAPLPYFHSTDQLPEAKFATAGLEGGYVVSRLVGPWREVTDA